MSGFGRLARQGRRSVAIYFAVFDHLILCNKDDFFFHGRSRRPPLDNVMRFFRYLHASRARHDLGAGIVGLDPAVGYLHRDRPGRPSLSLDLMEELRPALADRLALALINRQQVQRRF